MATETQAIRNCRSKSPHSDRVTLTRLMSWGFSIVALAFLISLVGVFVWQSLPIWHEVGTGYISGQKWFYRQHLFGTLPMIYGTVIVSLIGLLCAVPIGVWAAICTAEILPEKLRFAVKIVIELLAGVPSVIYGLLGIIFLREWVYRLLTPFDPLSGDTLLTAGLLVGVMILPTIMTLSDDALRGIPALQRQAARGLGLNRSEVVWSVVLPQARQGIIAAVLLALGRSLGEMIAVFLVVGRQDNQLPEKFWSLGPLFRSGQTLASKLGSSETNIAYGDPLHWAAINGLGLLLLLMVGTVTVVAFRLMQKDRHA